MPTIKISQDVKDAFEGILGISESISEASTNDEVQQRSDQLLNLLNDLYNKGFQEGFKSYNLN